MGRNTFLIFSIWQIITIASVLLSTYLHGYSVFYQISSLYIQNFLFFGCLFLPLMALSLIPSLRKITTGLSYVFGGIVVLINLINALYFVRYEHALSVVDFEIFFQSNGSESIEFLEFYTVGTFFQGVLIALVTLGVGIGIVHGFKRIPFKVRKFVIPVLIIALGTIYGLNVHRTPDASETNPFLTGYEATKKFQREKTQFDINQSNFYDTIQAESKIENDTNTIILVLGESTQRHHMSLYGYPNKTTPNFDKRKDELVVFKDVISPDSHTFPVLQHIFSSRRITDSKNWIEYPNMINVFKKAGYKTFWVSNQEANSIWGNTAKLISQLCDYTFYTETRENQKDSKKHDEVLLPMVDNIVNGDKAQKKLIIVHLMGTHGSYYHRYPKKYDVFKEEDVIVGDRSFLTGHHKRSIASYDNATLYNDYVVNEIFKYADNRPEKALCLYLSDHGEEIFDNRAFSGHSSHLMSSFMVEIPFIVHTNKTYRKRNKDIYSRLHQASNRPFSTENLPFFMYDVSELSTSLQDNKRNILHPDFGVNKDRISGGMHYSDMLQDKMLRESQDLSNIWVHRVNHTEKLRYLRSMQKNVEVDVVIHQVKDTFDVLVGHDVGDPDNFPLADYLKVLKGKHPIKLWLDIKNVNHQNINLFLDHLEGLIKENELSKEQFLLESTNLDLATSFMKAGYLASYYIWVPDVEKKTEAEKEEALKPLLAKIKQSKITRLSFDHELISAATNVFGKELPKVKFLSWNARKYFKTDLVYAFNQAQNPLVDVFLIKFKTEYDR